MSGGWEGARHCCLFEEGMQSEQSTGPAVCPEELSSSHGVREERAQHSAGSRAFAAVFWPAAFVTLQEKLSQSLRCKGKAWRRNCSHEDRQISVCVMDGGQEGLARFKHHLNMRIQIEMSKSEMICIGQRCEWQAEWGGLGRNTRAAHMYFCFSCWLLLFYSSSADLSRCLTSVGLVFVLCLCSIWFQSMGEAVPVQFWCTVLGSHQRGWVCTTRHTSFSLL